MDLEDLVHFDGWDKGDWAEFSRALEATKGMELGLYTNNGETRLVRWVSPRHRPVTVI